MARLGIAVGGPFDILGTVARRCEDAGFESLWVPETARTAFLQAAVAAQTTTTVRIGTAVALAFPRSPVITAMEARDLAELSGGRFVLGLGTQVKRVNQERYATPFEHPEPKMREIVEVCRAVWAGFAGEQVAHRGRFFTVTMQPFPGAGPAPGPIPIHVAAVKERMLRLAGERCDGFLGHPFSSPAYLGDVALPQIRAGVDAAARAPADVEIVQSLIVSVDDDREQARWAAKAQIAFYGTTRTYAGVFAHHGWEDVVPKLREAHAAADVAGMVACITDEMCDTYAAAGLEDEVRATLGRYDGLADTVVLNPPWAMPGMRTEDAFDRLIRLGG